MMITRNQDARDFFNSIRDKFPVFKFEKPVPLKIGISNDLIAAGILPKDVNGYLRIYANRRCYLLAIKKGRSRYDLDGNASAEITEKEAKYAKSQYKYRYERDKSSELLKAKAKKEQQKVSEEVSKPVSSTQLRPVLKLKPSAKKKIDAKLSKIKKLRKVTING